MFDLQGQLADTLLADPYFSNIPVLTQALGDIEQQITQNVDQMGGIVVVIVVPTADMRWDNMKPVYFSNVKLAVICIENVIINHGANGTGKGALEVALNAAVLLHQSQQPSGISESITCDVPTISLAPTPTPNRLAYYLRLKTMAGAVRNNPLPVVADPTVLETESNDTTMVTISTTTPGTTVWYTLDGTYPNPQNGHLYTGPFAVSPPLTVRCRGWIPGYKASNVIAQPITA